MLKLGKLTDYAITVMAQLARDNASRSASVLSDKTGVPEPTVAKVLKALSKAGLVTSERGVSGGYRIADLNVSVGAIIEAIDGPIAIVACVEEGESQCSAENRCPVKGKWTPVNTAIRDALFALKITDMYEATPARKLYQITTGESHAGHN